MSVQLTHPKLIQGGMGIAVSSWKLAKSVSEAGQLGVVSGTAIDSVLVRRLQDGDLSGHMRRALSCFPDQAFALEILKRYFKEFGRVSDESYLTAPKLSLNPQDFATQLLVAASFVEVWLAKEGHDGLVGINFLEKVQLATPASVYGAILAGADYIIMGAGIPSELPALITSLTNGSPTTLSIDVDGATKKYVLRFDPALIKGVDISKLSRPKFLAIISSHALAAYLNRDEQTRPDGFIVEGPTAGGHNAPPRGQTPVGPDGQSQFTDRDLADLTKVAAIGLPFWLAGGYATPEKLEEAISLGAVGVQAGSIFALANESGFTSELKTEVLHEISSGTVEIRTDPTSSSTGFPFKVVSVPGSLSDVANYEERPRLCDLGYLRVPFERTGKGIGYRCSAEPSNTYIFKGGADTDLEGTKCLCNALMTNIGLGQIRPDGYKELPLVTLGSDTTAERELLLKYPTGWSAKQAVEYLLGTVVD
jgi:NAD(P)H-dependent flavin oxidoreductase YrpB (nitropropane dioxygenase family)